MMEKIEDSEKKRRLLEFRRRIMKLGDIVDDENARIISLRIGTRIWAIGFRLSETRRELRGEMAENIVSAYLNLLGMHVEPPEKTCQDRIAVDPSTKNRVPVQVKSVSLERHGYAIRVDDIPLNEFTGFYIALFEREPADIILYIESGELQRLMHDSAKKEPGAKRHHKDYWELYIPHDLRGFRQYESSHRFLESVFGKTR